MEKKMSIMGVGGKIAVVLVLSVAITAGISFLLSPAFKITENYYNLVVVAIVMAVVGFAMCLIAAFGMLSATSKGRLATGGFYSVFLHPMYVCQLIITVPGLLLFFNSWLVLVSIVPTFIAFKAFAKQEERYLENRFGVEYKAYREKVLFKFL